MITQMFKYVDKKGTEAILKDGTLLFSSPLYLNDPFDVSIQTLFSYDPFDHQAHLNAFVDLILSEETLLQENGSDNAKKFAFLRSAISKKSTDYKENLKKDFPHSNVVWNEEELRASATHMLGKIKAGFSLSGIFCASKRFDNDLLWSHYAEKHHGAVLEFVPNVEKNSMLILAEEVTYSDERPHLYKSHKDFLIKSMFRSTKDVLDEYTKHITKTKSTKWAYEEEIRLYQPLLVNVVEGKKNHCLEYHSDELRTVYLGCKMDDQSRKNIIDLAKKRNPTVKIYEMTPDPNHYKLIPKQIENTI